MDMNMNSRSLPLVINSLCWSPKNFRRCALLCVVSFCLMLAQPIILHAAPQGGQVAAGEAAISVDAAATLIDQFTDKAVINWQGFDIDINELVRFIQPGTNSVALNRVTGGDPSAILGELKANGQVFLVNTNGILFGAGSQIDVAGLLTTTFDIEDGDFMAGKYEFLQDPDKDPSYIINKGEIKIAKNGFAYLVAPSVDNQGLIVAEMGQVVMGSGDAFTIDFQGDGLINFAVSGQVMEQVTGPDGQTMDEAVNNQGTITSAGGQVVLTADAAQGVISSVVCNEGIIEATSLVESGGSVTLTGDYVGNFGTIDVQGTPGADGGEVLLDSSTQTLVSSDALIDASGSGDSSGGEIILLSDTNTTMNGSLIARGGENAGDGGFIEVSSKGGLALNGQVDTLAPAGEIGTLLIDPKNITIDAGGAAGLADVDIFDEYPDGFPGGAATPVNIAAATINAAVAAVIIQANTDITVTSAINIAAAAVTLTLRAGRTVLISADITTNDAAIAITANDPGAVDNRDAGTGDISMTAGTTIDANGGHVTLTVQGTDPAKAGAVTIDEIVTDDGTTKGNVTIVSYGSIIESDADTDIDIDGAIINLTVKDADGLIGAEGNPLEIDAGFDVLGGNEGYLIATTAGGNIVISDRADGLALDEITTGSNTEGTVIIDAYLGAIMDANGGNINITAAAANLTTSGIETVGAEQYGGSIGFDGVPIDTDVGVLTATADNGGIFFYEADEVLINTLTAKDLRRTPYSDENGNVVVNSSGSTSSYDVTVNAGGNIGLGNIITGDTATVTARTGTIIDNADGMHVTASIVSLDAVGDIGQSASPINTNVETISAVTDDGAIYLTEGTGATLQSLVAVGTDKDIIFINTGGDLALGTITAAGDTVSITNNGGNITDADGPTLNVTADDVTLSSTTGVGSSGDPMETTVTSLTASATESSSPLYIANTTVDLTSVSASVKDSVVSVTDGGTALLTFNDGTDALTCAVTGVPITFANTNGGVAISSLNAGSADVDLTASGAITQSAGTLTAGRATLTAGTNIGADGTEISTSADELVMTTTDGGIFVAEADAVTVTASASGTDKDVEVTNTTGDMTLNAVSATGDVSLTATAGSLLDGNGSSTNVTGDTATLVAGTAIGTSGDSIETDVDTLAATSQAGGLYVTEKDGLTLLDAAATGGDIGISASGDVTIGEILAAGQTVTFTTSGAITDEDDDDLGAKTVNITALTLDLTGQSIGVSDNRIEIAIGELVVESTSGGIYIHQPGATDLTLTSATSNGTGSDVDIKVNKNIALGAVEAKGDRVYITSETGAITDGNGATLNVEAKSLDIDGPNGVGTAGDPLEFKVDFLSAAGGGTGVAASNTGALAVDSSSLTGKGAVEVAIVADEITVLDNSGGTITMDAGGTLVLRTTTGDIVFLNQEDTIDASGGGDVTLQAGWDNNGCGAVIVAGNLITNGGGDITVQADFIVTIGLLDTTGGTGTIVADGDVTVQSRNGIILDGNGATNNIIADNVTLSGYTPTDKDAEIHREKAIAEYYAKISETASKLTTWDTWAAANGIHNSLVSQAAITQSLANTDNNTKLSTFNSEESTRSTMYDWLRGLQITVKALTLAKDIVDTIAGAAQAIPFTGDGGSATVAAVATIALDVADIALAAYELTYDSQASDAQAARDELDQSRAQLYAANQDLVLARGMASASDEASGVAEASYDAAVIARDHSREVEEQAILAEDTANVIGTSSQALGVKANRVDIFADRQSAVYLESPGVLGLGDIDATGTGMDIIATAVGNITVLGTVNSPDRVWLESTGGSILDGAGSVVADELIAEASTGIGSPDGLLTSVGKIAAKGGTGGVLITNTNGTSALYITDLEDVSGVSGDGNITISTTDDLNLESAIEDTSATNTVTLTSSGGAIVDDNEASMNITTSSLVVSAVTGVEFDTDVDDVTINNTGAGAILVRESDAVELTSLTAANGAVTVSAGGDIDVVSVVSSTDSDDNDISITATGGGDILVKTVTAGATSGDVTLTAAGTIDDDNNNGTKITGDVLTLTAPGGIGGSGGNSTRALDTSVKSLTATVVTGGEINIAEANDLDVTSAFTANGNVTITSAAGSLNVTEISADTANDTVTLIASGSITDAVADSAADNLTARNLAMTAGTGIGAAANIFEITVANLEASGGSGGIYVTDLADGLIIGGVTPNLGNPALTGLLATGNNIEVIALSPVTINEAVTNTGTGNIEITAGASESDDDITINANISSTNGTGGNITLTAADSIDQNENVTITGDGNVTMDATAGNIDVAGSKDITVGGAGDIDLTAGDGISAGSGAEISVGANGDIDLDAGLGISQGASATIAIGGDGNITADAADGDIDMLASSSMITSGDGDIALTASDNIDMGENTVVDVDGASGTANDVTFTASAGYITMQDEATTSTNAGDIEYSAATNIIMEINSDVVVDGDGNVTFIATGGDIDMQAGTSAEDNTNVTIGDDGDIIFTAGDGADDDITLGLYAHATVGNDGDISFTASDNIDMGNDAVVDVVATGDVEFTATAGNITMQDRATTATSAGVVDGETVGGITYSAGDSIIMEIDSDVVVDSDGDVVFTATAGDINLQAGTSAVNNTNVTIGNDGDITFTAGDGADDDIILEKWAHVNTGSAADDVGNITFTASDNISLGQEAEVAVAGLGDITADATAGDLTTGTDANVSIGDDGDIYLDAGLGISHGVSSTVAIGGDGDMTMTADDGDVVMLSQATVITTGDGDITYLASANINLGVDTQVDMAGGGAAGTGDVSFTATSGGITLQDRATVSTSEGDDTDADSVYGIKYSAGTDIVMEIDSDVVVDSDGDIVFTATAGDINLQAGTSAVNNTNVTIGHDGDITFTAGDGADDDIILEKWAHVNTGSAMDDIGNITFTASDNISLGQEAEVSVAGLGDITADATAGDLTTGTDANVSIGDDGDIYLDAGLGISHGVSSTVAIGGDGDMTITADDGDVVMLSQATAITTGDGDIIYLASGNINLGVDTLVDMAGGGAAGTGDVSFTATSGGITLQDRATVSTSEGDSTDADSVYGIKYSAGTDIVMEIDSDVVVDSDGDIVFTATAGDINLHAGTSTGDNTNVTIGDNGDITFTAGDGADDDIILGTYATVTTGSAVTETGDITFTASDNISLGQESDVSVAGLGDITADATAGNLTTGLDANISVGDDGDIDLDAGLGISHGVSSTVAIGGDGDMTMTADDGDVVMLSQATAITTGDGDIIYLASGNINMGENTRVDVVGSGAAGTGDVTFTATAGSITMQDEATTATSAGVVDGETVGGITYSAGDSIIMEIDSDVVVDSDGNIIFTATAGDINLQAGTSAVNNTNVTIGNDGDITFTAGDGADDDIILEKWAHVNTGSAMDDVGDITFTASDNISLGQEAAVAVAGLGDITADATAGDLTTGTDANVSIGDDGDIDLDAGLGISHGVSSTVAIGGDGDMTMTADDGDVVMLTEATAITTGDGDITYLASANINLGADTLVDMAGGGAAGTGDVSFTATSGSITMQDRATVSTSEGDDTDADNVYGIKYSAGTDIVMEIDSDVVVDSDGNIIFTATGGDINLQAGTSAVNNTNVTIGHDGDITFTAGDGADDDIILEKWAHVNTGSAMDDIGNITFTASDNISLGQEAEVAVAGLGDITADATAGDLTTGTDANVSIGDDGDIYLDAGLGISHGVSSTVAIGGDGDMTMTADDGDVVMLSQATAITTGDGDITYLASGNINMGVDTVVDMAGGGAAGTGDVSFTATSGGITLQDRATVSTSEGDSTDADSVYGIKYSAGTDIVMEIDSDVVVDSDGDIVFTATAGDINLHAGTSTGDNTNVTIGDNGDITFTAGDGADDDIILGTYATVTTGSAVTETGDITFTASDNISLGQESDVSVAGLGDITADATAGNLTTGLDANISVGDDGDIDLDAGLGISHGVSSTVAIGGDGDMIMTADDGDVVMLSQATAITTGDGDITYLASGNINLGVDTVVDMAGGGAAGTGDVSFTATSGSITMQDRATVSTSEGDDTDADNVYGIKYSAGTDIVMEIDSDVVVDSDGDIIFTATAGDINLQAGTSAGDNTNVTIGHDGDITFTAGDGADDDIILGLYAHVIVGNDGDITFTATDNIDLGDDAVADIVATGDVEFTATAGNITMQDRATTSTNAGVVDGETVGGITFTAGDGEDDDIILGLYAHATVGNDGDISFTASDNINLGEDAVVDITSNLSGDVTFTATAGDITLQDRASVTTGAGDDDVEDIDGISFTAGTDITLEQNAVVGVDANGNLKLTAAGGDLDMQNGSSTTVGGNGNIELTASDNVSQGINTNVSVTGIGHVSIEATAGQITMDAGATTTLTAGDVEYTAGTDIAVNVITTLDGNAILEAIAGAITDINGAVLNITADDLDATAALGIGEVGDALDITVDTLTATTTGSGPIVINETDGIELTSVTAADGLITIDAAGDIAAVSVVSTTDDDDNDITITATGGGSIAIDAINAGTGAGDVTLTADTGGGTVTTNQDPDGRLTGDALTVTAVNEICLATTGNSADMSVTGAGLLLVDEENDIILTDLDTADGAIDVQAGSPEVGGSITAIDVLSNTDHDDNYISLTAIGGDVVVDLVQAGLGAEGDVYILARETITERVTADAAADVIGDEVFLLSGTGVGNGDGGPVDTSAVTLGALAMYSGDININESDGVIIEEIVANDGGVTVTTESAGAGNTLVTKITAEGEAGNVSITSLQDGTMTVVEIAADGDVDLTATGGAIVDDLENDTVIACGALTLTAPGGIGGIGATATRALDTDVTSLTATAAIAGQINIAETNDLDIIAVTAANGDVTIASAAGSLNVTTIVADIVDDVVTLAAAGSITDAVESEDANITALDTALTAGEGIGTAANPLDLLVDKIEADGGTGGIYVIDLDGGLTIGGVTPALNGLEVTGGDIEATARSPITVNEEINNTGGGDINLVSEGTDPFVDFITVNSDINATGGDGNVNLDASDSVIQNANITTGGGDVNVNAEEGDITMGPGTTTTTGGGNVTYGAGDDLAVNEINTGGGTNGGGNVTLDVPDGEIEDVNEGAPNIVANNISVNTESGTGTQADETDTANDTGFLDDLIGKNVPHRVTFNNRIMGGSEMQSLDTAKTPISSISTWFDIGGIGMASISMWGLTLRMNLIDPALQYRHDSETGRWFIDPKYGQRQESSGLLPETAAPAPVPEVDQPAVEKPVHLPRVVKKRVHRESSIKSKIKAIWDSFKGQKPAASEKTPDKPAPAPAKELKAAVPPVQSEVKPAPKKTVYKNGGIRGKVKSIWAKFKGGSSDSEPAPVKKSPEPKVTKPARKPSIQERIKAIWNNVKL